MSSPFSYIYFTFTSNDTSVSHDVQIYSEIAGGKLIMLLYHSGIKIISFRMDLGRLVKGDDMVW